MANHNDSDPFEEDIVFDQSDLLRKEGRNVHMIEIQQRTSGMPAFFLIARTLSLCTAFIALGLCAAVSQGPVIHMEVLEGIPSHIALHIFTAYCLGMLLGGVLGSLLFELYNRQFLIFVSLVWMGISVIILPFTIEKSFWFTLTTLIALGSGLSFLSTGCNVLFLDMWGRRSSAYIQALHFSFALGAFLTPLIINPFFNTGSNHNNSSTQVFGRYPRLASEAAESSSKIDAIVNKSVNSISLIETPLSTEVHSILNENEGQLSKIVRSYEKYGVTGLHIAYILIGVFLLVNAAASMIFLCINPREPKSKQMESRNLLSKFHMKAFVICFSIYMFSTEALQGSVHHMLAASSLISNNSDGQAIFWGLVCSVRLLCIFAMGCCDVRPGNVLVGCNVIMILGTILVSIGSFNKYDFIFAGIVVIALGIAPVLPSCFLWMSMYMKVTHKMCATMIIVSSFGNSITHTSLAYVPSSSHLYAYIMIFISSLSLLFLFLSFFVLFKCASFSQYHLTNQLDDEDGLPLSQSTITNDYDPSCDFSESSQALLID